MFLQPEIPVRGRGNDPAAHGRRRGRGRLVQSRGGGHAARGALAGVGADLEGRVGGDELGEDV
ncbi:hypothetical protein IMZ48_34635 [Candidatus Bathyarchaeota archaeon]|nr:hypothetical protein [Candidatus Bathyarchaeota archaeon]